MQNLPPLIKKRYAWCPKVGTCYYGLALSKIIIIIIIIRKKMAK